MPNANRAIVCRAMAVGVTYLNIGPATASALATVILVAESIAGATHTVS